MKNFNAIITIAYRDFVKFLRDRSRIVATFVFPFVFVGILGRSLQSNLGSSLSFNFLTFTFTGVLAQTLFQSAAAGLISLIEDRENDFSQELFIAPVSRYSIITGKILGESAVALTQGVGIVIFGLISGVHMSFFQLARLLPVGLLICIFGGAFGLFVLSNLRSQRAANQVFPFIIFPQIFISGIFTPIKNLPPLLFILSRIVPLTYAVDLFRNLFYIGTPDYNAATLYHPLIDIVVSLALMLVFLVVGTSFFVRNERNR